VVVTFSGRGSIPSTLMSINLAYTNHEVFWIHLFLANQVYIYIYFAGYINERDSNIQQNDCFTLSTRFVTCLNSEIESAGFPQYRKQSLVGG